VFKNYSIVIIKWGQQLYFPTLPCKAIVNAMSIANSKNQCLFRPVYGAMGKQKGALSGLEDCNVL